MRLRRPRARALQAFERKLVAGLQYGSLASGCRQVIVPKLSSEWSLSLNGIAMVEEMIDGEHLYQRRYPSHVVAAIWCA